MPDDKDISTQLIAALKRSGELEKEGAEHKNEAWKWRTKCELAERKLNDVEEWLTPAVAPKVGSTPAERVKQLVEERVALQADNEVLRTLKRSAEEVRARWERVVDLATATVNLKDGDAVASARMVASYADAVLAETEARFVEVGERALALES